MLEETVGLLIKQFMVVDFVDSAVVSVACRGSWMPGANDIFGCPQVKKMFLSFHLRKFLATFSPF